MQRLDDTISVLCIPLFDSFILVMSLMDLHTLPGSLSFLICIEKIKELGDEAKETA